MATDSDQFDLPVPRINVDGKAFWEGTRDERLLFKRCSACGHIHYPPRHLCPKCWSDQADWLQSSGVAKVYSFTIMRRAPSPEFTHRVPYVVALVECAEGPRMMSNIVGDDALDVRVGDAVHLVFEERTGVNVPQFARKRRDEPG